jgi:ice-binding like protein/Big-like domain-containing protein
VLTALAAISAVMASGAQAATVPLGTANPFAVLGGSTVTNTGPSVINGDLGVSPLTSITGFPPGVVNGTVHPADGVASGAQDDLVIAYDNAAGRSSDVTLSADPVGSTLAPGTYTASSSLDLSGDVTLDAHQDPNAVFVFQVGSGLTVASGSRILLQGGAQACNVFWQVGTSATIGSGSAFVGNILALTSISMDTGATLDGRALARNGAVTLDTNTITKSTCAPPAPPTSGDISATTESGTPVSIQLNGGDTTGATLTYTITGQPSNGTLGPIDQTTGTVLYTPGNGFSGSDSFTYEVSSNNGTSDTATGAITVTAGPPSTVPPTTAGVPATPTTTIALKKKLQKKNHKHKAKKQKRRHHPAFTG